MNDPHVEQLFYKLRTGENLEFLSPHAIEADDAAFHIRLEDGRLCATMKEHHGTEESARSCVQKWLRTWELDRSIHFGQRSFWFEFEESKIIDRNPPKPGDPIVIRPATGHFFLTGHAPTCVLGQRSYPPPPQNFVASPDVETMWFRYQMFLDGKEPLLSMAYACLSLLEGSTGAKDHRKAVCKMYNIEEALRKKLGDIVSEKGGPHEARKLGTSATKTSLTEREKCWVADVIKALIRRKGEYDANPSATFPPIALANFPPV